MNRIEHRATVRNLLSDPTPGVYSDATIDAALDRAYYRVAPYLPAHSSDQLTLVAGASTITLSHHALAVKSVHSPRGPVTVAAADELAYPIQLNRQLLYAQTEPTTITLSRPINQSESGTWLIRYTYIPDLPPSPATAWDISVHIESAIDYYAAADLVRSRALATARHGSKADYTTQLVATRLEQDADFVIRSCTRLARMT